MASLIQITFTPLKIVFTHSVFFFLSRRSLKQTKQLCVWNCDEIEHSPLLHIPMWVERCESNFKQTYLCVAMVGKATCVSIFLAI